MHELVRVEAAANGPHASLPSTTPAVTTMTSLGESIPTVVVRSESQTLYSQSHIKRRAA